MSGCRKWSQLDGALPTEPAQTRYGPKVVVSLRQWEVRKAGAKSTQATRKGKRKTESQSWGAHNDNRSFKKSGRLASTKEKRAFARDHLSKFGSVSEACRAIELSISSYYYQPKREKILARSQAETDVRDLIEKVQAEFPFYGYRRIRAHMKRKCGVIVNRKKVLRIMRKFGLKALIWRGFKVKTTDSDHPYGYAPNLLPGLKITGVNQVWVTDITYIRIKTGFVYLAAILDLYSRRIVGWAISENINAELCLTALDDAIRKRNPRAGLIHHSDRGVQYACVEYRKRLLDNEILESMSAKGYCYDNAFMESWFKTLKAEEVYLTEYEKTEDVLKNVPQFIETVYNEKRLHSSLGYFSPVEFEGLAAKGQLKQQGINPVMQLPGKPSN